MVATIMEKITSLVKKLQRKATEYPHLQHLTLQQGEMFGWNHTACVITYDMHTPNAAAYLLHEFGHATLSHTNYQHDIELLKMERAAWDQAAIIAAEYDIGIEEARIEEALDSYRDWLHSRSLCPECSATGVQTGHNNYACISCGGCWRVNDARTCALRRYSKKRPS